MILKAYCIYDSCAAVFQRPFFSQSDPLAQRAFCDLVSDAQHPVAMHPEDYSLWVVGSFDDSFGLLLANELLANETDKVLANEPLANNPPKGTNSIAKGIVCIFTGIEAADLIRKKFGERYAAES